MKVVLDLKVKILSVMESPRYRELVTKVLPQALQLHKSLTRVELSGINDHLKDDPWNLSINRLKQSRIETALIVYENTRKGYLKYYNDLLTDYSHRHFSCTSTNSKEHQLVTIM